MNKRVKLKNVRLSYPSLFKRSSYEGKEGKYEATFLIQKSDEKLKQEIDTEIQNILKETKIKVPKSNYCVKDGDEKYDDDPDKNNECKNNWLLKASNNSRPLILNKDKSNVIEEDEVIYAGCYVNAIVDFWVQNNKYGKRVNANLYGVQFVKDGERFGNGIIDVSSEFDDLEDI